MSDKIGKVDDSDNKAKEFEAKYGNLRLLPIDTINEMLQYVYNTNEEAFTLYFNLLRAKEYNKVQYKPDDKPSETVTKQGDDALANTPNDDKS